jgi:hypothetical protein
MEREERRRTHPARRAEEKRLRRWRRWAAWAGVPAAAALPVLVAAGAAGWGHLDVLVAAFDLPRLAWWPASVAIGALCGAGGCAWMAARAPTRPALLAMLGGGFAGGVIAVFAARELPVHRAWQGAGAGGRLVHGRGDCTPPYSYRLSGMAGVARISQ